LTVKTKEAHLSARLVRNSAPFNERDSTKWGQVQAAQRSAAQRSAAQRSAAQRRGGRSKTILLCNRFGSIIAQNRGIMNPIHRTPAAPGRTTSSQENSRTLNSHVLQLVFLEKTT